MMKHQCMGVGETHVYGGAHEPRLEDRHCQLILMILSRSLQIGLGRFAFVAWPMMKIAPILDQKVTINRTWLALKRLTGGRILREEDVLPLAVGAEVAEAMVMEALV